MAAGILDNTLNLQSEVTNERDSQAWGELKRIGELPEDFADEYFEACYAEIKADLVRAIRDDTKIEKVSPMLPEVFGQIIVPKIEDFEAKVLSSAFAEYSEWMMNVIALKDGKSYIYFSENKAKDSWKSCLRRKQRVI